MIDDASARHRAKWLGHPTFPHPKGVATTAHDGEHTWLMQILDELEDLWKRVKPYGFKVWQMQLAAFWMHWFLGYFASSTDGWPDDAAARMLADWRTQLHGKES